MPLDDPEGRVEQALTDLVGYVFRHEVPLRRALTHVEFDFGMDVRRVVADLLITVDRQRQPRTARELVWGAVALFVANSERSMVDVTEPTDVTTGANAAANTTAAIDEVAPRVS
jgi:hypothetical protein